MTKSTAEKKALRNACHDVGAMRNSEEWIRSAAGEITQLSWGPRRGFSAHESKMLLARADAIEAERRSLCLEFEIEFVDLKE